MERRIGPKIYGPYEHGDQYRVHVVTCSGGRRKTSYHAFATRALAEAFIAGAKDQAKGATVKATVEAFLARKRQSGCAESTIESDEDRLAMILGSVMNRAIRSVSSRGEELYTAAQVYPQGHRRAGQRRAADTHQNALAVAKDWAGFCVKRRWLKANPFAEVESVGRRVEGADKVRLTVDESRQLQAFCHAHAATDLGAVLTLAYLLLGPRASELVRRPVRDVDDSGRLLWIGATKTKAGRRRLLVPDELAVYLVAIAAGRRGDEPLFVSVASRRWPGGRRWSRHMAYNHVRRICEAAGVPDVAPQALRRTQATLATDAGATGLMVAEHLGHAVGRAPAVTHRSYVERDAARDASVDRGLRVLHGRRQIGRSVETLVETDPFPADLSVSSTLRLDGATCGDC